MRLRTPSDRIFTRRAFVVGGLQLAALGALGGRLAWLQVVEGKRYATLSDDNRIDIQIIAPLRGEILDATGAPLATGAKRFSLMATPGKAAERSRDLRRVLRDAQEFVDLSEVDVAAALERASRSPSFLPVLVRQDLSWEEVSAVSVRAPELPGLSIATDHQRLYPLGAATAHVVGYVGAVSQADLRRDDDPLLALPGAKIGKTGLEKAREGALRGVAGAAEVEVNARGRRVRELRRRPPTPGARLGLTLHAGLQEAVAGRLSGQRSASAAVVDARSGAVRALVSHPAFDPNAFVTGLSAAAWEGLLADPGHPLTNKAAAGLYPPASTFKMVTALAALSAGLCDTSTRVDCPGYYDFGGERFHCWKTSGHGSMDLVQALAQSCDTFFYHIATEVGIARIAAMARRLGLGARLGVGLPEEGVGLVPDKAWKMGAVGRSWKAGETVVAAIGQGYIQATPLQMATMVARLADPRARAVAPFLVESVDGRAAERPAPGPLGIDPGHLALVRRGMEAVVTAPLGTARNSAIAPGLGWQMAGKTGTAQVRRITAAQRAAGVRNENLPWKQRHHALFVGYAPVVEPRYAVSVVVEHGGGGGRAAAPLAREILAEAMRIGPG